MKEMKILDINERLPKKNAYCVIFSEEFGAINCELAYYCHTDKEWRFLRNNEKVIHKVGKYIEITTEDRDKVYKSRKSF